MLLLIFCALIASQWVESIEGSPLKFSLLVDGFDATKIPGTPKKDYPVYRDIPQTKFGCDNMVPGIYADLDTSCQVFHICDVDNRRFTFLCPNGTIFNEKNMKCDWWNKVTCKKPKDAVNLLFPFKSGNKFGKPMPADSSQPVAQDRTFDLVESIADLIRATRRSQDDYEDNEYADSVEERSSRFRDVFRKMMKILTNGF